jgi:hypothetical protein
VPRAAGGEGGGGQGQDGPIGGKGGGVGAGRPTVIEEGSGQGQPTTRKARSGRGWPTAREEGPVWGLAASWRGEVECVVTDSLGGGARWTAWVVGIRSGRWAGCSFHILSQPPCSTSTRRGGHARLGPIVPAQLDQYD